MGLQIVKLIDAINLSISGTFAHQGEYNGATDYAVGDAVEYNGSTYIMYSDAAAGTLPTNTTYWHLMVEKGDTGATGSTGSPGAAGDPGLTWRGDYDNATAYAVNDGVAYLGQSYICTATSTGNLPTDTDFWNILASKGVDGVGFYSGAEDTVTVAADDLVAIKDTTDGTAKYVTAQGIADLSTSGLANIVEDTTPQLGGNLDVNGQDIVTTSNGDIDLAPNGTGKVNTSGHLYVNSSKGVYSTYYRANSAQSNTLQIEATGGTTGGSVLINSGSGTTGNGGDIKLSPQASTSGGSNGKVVIVNPTNNYEASFITSSLSANRAYTLPNQAGTIALTSDIPGSGIANLVEDVTPQLGGALDLNGNNITTGATTITPTEMSYIDGVTSAIQGQLDGKQATLTGLTSSVAELNILDGVTATASELNALDGITATTTELNYTDGVTSAIQTQLDAKAPLTGTIGYVNHGSTAGTSRPSGYGVIFWYGSVEPTNATDGDVWVDVS